MPFELLEYVQIMKKGARASISYRRNDTKHGKGKQPKLVVAIPMAVVGPGLKLKKGGSYEFLIGNGADKGKARIMPGAKGVAPTVFKHGYVFRFGFVPKLGTDAADREDCDVKVLGAEIIEITLPAWFK